MALSAVAGSRSEERAERWTSLPRFWTGMPLGATIGLLRAGGLRNVELAYWPRVAATILCGSANSALGLVQERLYGDAIEKIEIQQPVIILGHMRSGTTLLHNLLALDRRLRAPRLRECFTPGHCLVSARLVKGGAPRLLPAKRPQDDMHLSFQSPEEEEFALMNMGLPSPYRQAAFPNIAEFDANYVDFIGVSENDRRRWQEALRRFVKVLTVRRPGRRVVLKSPFHLGRVRVLLDVFPGARFVHIVRNPYRVFPSTLSMVSMFYRTQGFQTPKLDRVEAQILSYFERLYRQFERDRPLIPAGRLHELRYEDLVGNPERELQQLYSALDLGSFDPVAAKVKAYFAARTDYRVGKHQLDPAMQREIDRRWTPWLRRFGYCEGHQVSQVDALSS